MVATFAGKAIAIDLGGTKISWALVDQDYDILWKRQQATPSTGDEILGALDHIISDTAAAAENISGAGIGIAALVDHKAGSIIAAPNLPLLGDGPADYLRSKYNMPIHFDNDANLAALGEMCAGAAKGADSFVGLTIGTGVGGGLALGGKLWRGGRGAAAEVGHMIVDPRGPLCGCGNYGCLETKASGTAIEREAKEAIVANPNSALARAVGGDPSIITGHIVSRQAHSGDSVALEVLSGVGGWLGIGIGNLINILDPELVVVGGGASEAIALVMDSVRAAADATAIDPRSPEIPIVISKLENNAGLIGAAGLVLRAD